MKAFVFALATLLLALFPARADVVIYKGTLKNKGSSDLPATYPATISQYLFIDFASLQVTTLNYYTKAGDKIGDYTVYGTPRFTQAPLVQGKPGRIIAICSRTDSTDVTFSYGYTEFRGPQVPLTIRKIPAIVTLTEPKSFTVFDHYVFNATSFGGLEGLLTFQSKATLDANAANQDIISARDKIADDLRAKGYIIP